MKKAFTHCILCLFILVSCKFRDLEEIEYKAKLPNEIVLDKNFILKIMRCIETGAAMHPTMIYPEPKKFKEGDVVTITLSGANNVWAAVLLDTKDRQIFIQKELQPNPVVTEKVVESLMVAVQRCYPSLRFTPFSRKETLTGP